MSFVNLMASDVWSEADIVNRMEGIIRGYCSQAEEMILHRKMLGASIGAYSLSAAEQAEIGEYAAVCKAAQDAGRAARADMALLAQALAVEAAQAALAADPSDADAQAVISAATPDVTTLVEQRAAAAGATP